MGSMGGGGDGSIFAGRMWDVNTAVWTNDGCFVDVERRKVWEVCCGVIRHLRGRGVMPSVTHRPHVPEAAPEYADPGTSRCVHPNTIVTGWQTGNNPQSNNKGWRGVEEGLEVENVFEVFAFRERDQMVWEVEGVTDVIVNVTKIGTFSWMPGNVDGANVDLGRMEIIVVMVWSAIGYSGEGAVWIRNTDNEEVVHPFPGGTDVTFMIGENRNGTIGTFDIEGGSLSARWSGGHLEGGRLGCAPCTRQIRGSIGSVNGIELPKRKTMSDFIRELLVLVKKIGIPEKEFELVSAIRCKDFGEVSVRVICSGNDVEIV
ncbi:uncharacterized protein EDB91DRAFT_1085584 [Suillus paluster]|uniref:uncharacterized protein n=1 Tax=Suillus paluster TaxID=48578 RepID=UPI001B861524|nr:uncharacterized protein EDB91DRAFT_1085584 [Suillus paluster]KAG1729952.1 hypothetical protein EDB91DRAFT_1085584 [Suillus paluster]